MVWNDGTTELYHYGIKGMKWGVGDELEYRGLDDNYFPNEIGKMCESILDIVP